MKKKVMLFMPSMDGGGVEKNLILVANYLSEKYKIQLITFDKRFNSRFKKNISILNFVNNPVSVNKYIKYICCLIILFKNIFFEKKLVFAFQANIYCLILCKILNCPIILRSNSSPSGWTTNKIKNLIFSKLLVKSNDIIVNSKKFKTELDSKFKTNSIVILNPLDRKNIIVKSKKKIKFSFFQNKNELKIINIARFTNQKDHITLLKAFNLISKKIDTKLLIVGYGPNLVKIKEYIKLNNLNTKVKIKNYMLNPYPYIKKSDLFILSSLYEGLPNVLLESMTLKKFIISSNCPTGPSEILNNGEYGYLFKPRKYKSLAAKIFKFYNNRSKVNKNISKGYKSLKKFDFKHNCEKYKKVIEKHIL